MLAGVTVNLLIAFLLFFVVIAGRGVAEGPSTTVNTIVERQRRRDRPGCTTGDRIVAVDGQPVRAGTRSSA